jgi:tRNA 2-thiouridine synthesizing protein D
MSNKKTLTFVLMDPPYEDARSTTALRLIDLAVRRGHDVNVFAYEGAVNLAFAKQTPHANAVHGRDLEQEDHPNPKEWIAAILNEAEQRGSKVEWVQCGLCVDERGAGDCIQHPSIRRGSPADLVKFTEGSDNTLVIPTK